MLFLRGFVGVTAVFFCGDCLVDFAALIFLAALAVLVALVGFVAFARRVTVFPVFFEVVFFEAVLRLVAVDF